MLCRFESNWQEPLIIVKPETVVRWHQMGFKLFWRFKFRQKVSGRPPISTEIRDLILKIAAANPLWDAPRIHGELLKLGIKISMRTVSNLLYRWVSKPPSQTWRKLLKNRVFSVSVRACSHSLRSEPKYCVLDQPSLKFNAAENHSNMVAVVGQ
jgi:hypothetical protein